MKYSLTRKDRLVVLRIVTTYALFGCVWIYLSDTFLSMLISDSALIARYSVYKGFLFISVTVYLLYHLIISYLRELKQTEESLRKLNEELEVRVAERTKELEKSQVGLETQNVELQKETARRILAMEELREKELLLIQQSRLAAMGEMISNIAHQWRQPLNSIALIIQELPVMYRKGEFSEEYLKAMVDRAKNHVFNMSQTIEDFKNFFQPNKERVKFKARDMVDKALALVKDSFDTMHIKIVIDEMGDPVIDGYPNEFSQTLLNIFLNSRDAFLQRDEDKPRIIKVRIFSQNDKTVVAITDNAGGIPEVIIGKIFDPYFTTKGPEKGTGIGLFMTKTIIEKHMNGKISAQNRDDGTEVRIEVDSEAPP